MRIDRRSLVQRHRIRRTETDSRAPVQLGNGEFGLSLDITGLQTFPELHPHTGRDPEDPGSLLGTQSQWGWHTTPRDPRPELRSALRSFDTARGEVPYVDLSTRTFGDGPETGTAEELWLRQNPHRLMLGWIGLAPSAVGSEELAAEDLVPIQQELDLWTGIAESEFTLRGFGFTVRTAVHPTRDAVAFTIRTDSPHPPALRLRFPYGSGAWGNAVSWAEERHSTTVQGRRETAQISRSLDETTYVVSVDAAGPLKIEQPARHEVLIAAEALAQEQPWQVAVSFRSGSPAPDGDHDSGVTPAEVFEQSQTWWQEHWSTGGVVDLAESTDLRAPELERRIVLSQYLTAINCSGSTPPQETGLMINSWRGKFHLEMHWWHAAHFPVWGRPELLMRSLQWYRDVLPQARQTAAAQGVTGARWPKQVGPDGEETPSDIGPFLLWQQPHLIYFAELLRRSTGMDQASQYAELVFETAEFMATHPIDDDGAASLEAPLIPAQECYGDVKEELADPTFELAYWHWGLNTAIRWRELLGLEPVAAWARTRDALRPPSVRGGVYPAIRRPVLDRRTDHPSVLGALGVVPETPLIDEKIMENTLLDVLGDWDWESTWGWDYPMIAMSAARLGRPELAVDALLMPAAKNTFLSNGHNWQNEGLPLYLPGNGGLLMAVGLMAAGWDGSGDAPGFPSGFIVKHEGLTQLPP
ncbi:hypothetical protein [Nesterenkonia lutea]|nr:hypothetical protein [Nesterenkonia lutea]